MYKKYILYYSIILFFIIFILFIYIKYPRRITEYMTDSYIPLNIYQTWSTLELLPYMQKSVQLLREDNPSFKYQLYDDYMCMDFIKFNFPTEVFNAYNILIPGAYKADLFRYCILYKNGGIYLDIKYHTIDHFNLIELTDKEYFVKDIGASNNGIYNACLICKPYNLILKKCIYDIVENVKSRYYGKNPLEITGPLLMKKYFTKNEFNNLELQHHFVFDKKTKKKDCYIAYKNKYILKMYDGYREEQTHYYLNNNSEHYSKLWYKRKVYT